MGELTKILTRGGDGRVRVDAQDSSSIDSVLKNYFGGQFEILPDAWPPLNDPFHYRNQSVAATRVRGQLHSPFLGSAGAKVDAVFFVLNGNCEALVTVRDFREPLKLSSMFALVGGAQLNGVSLHDCVFTFDSTRPYDLGDDFDACFAPDDKSASRGSPRKSPSAAHVTARLQLAEVDAALSDFLAAIEGTAKAVTVAGPVELAERRMRLATAEQSPLGSLDILGVQSKLHYEVLTAQALPQVLVRERLGLSVTVGGLSIPLQVVFTPDSLTESVTIESFDFKHPLKLSDLMKLIPGADVGDAVAAIPGMNDVKLTKLRFEISDDTPVVKSVEARIELAPDGGWTIIPKVLVFNGLACDISAMQFADSWEVHPYVSATVAVAGGELDVAVDVAAKTFGCGLREGQTLALSALFKQFQFDVPDGLSQVAIDALEIWGALDGSNYLIEVGTRFDWAITDGLKLERLFFSMEYEKVEGEGSRALMLGGSVAIAGVSVTLVARTDPQGGWLFEGRTGLDQSIPLGKLFGELVRLSGLQASLPPALDSFAISNLVLSYNTRTEAFVFGCRGGLPLSADGPMLTFAIQIETKTQRPFSGIITVGGASFALVVQSDTAGHELQAAWKYEESQPRLDLQALSNDLPDLSSLGALLIPQAAQLKLKVVRHNGELQLERLAIACSYPGDIKAAVLLARDSSVTPATWVVALGIQPGRISTESLGALGSALRPHNLALNKLVVVAASGDAGKDMRLAIDGQDCEFNKGLLLRGALEFESTSFSFPFECRLGGAKPRDEGEVIEGESSTESTSTTETSTQDSSTAKTEVETGNNNLSVGRTIGPVTFRKARLEARDKRVYLLIDASLGTGGFALDLIGFNLNFPLTVLQDPVKKIGELRVGLDGLSIAYSMPPLTICGGFARTTPTAPYVDDLYQGSLLIKAAAFQVSVLGSYGTTLVKEEKKPALFIYGTYQGMLGGPPAFFVTGLALGGGYNTRLSIPPVEGVAQFPLVQAVTDPVKFKIDSLREAVLPSHGDYWLALGVKFTSFKMADSFALFSVGFGNRLNFALLGLTKLAVPTAAVQGMSVVYAELAIRAVVDPEAGIVGIEGRLTQNSYVLAKELRLLGGFAFFVWFGSAKEAGDFVVSLGGYHPSFLPPAHYPVVPRIGIRGQLSSYLAVGGEAYFALTPSCVMAGIKLEAVFAASVLRAAFVAYADFVVAWAPFYYDAKVGMAIVVSLQLWRTYKLEISARLHVWGPPFAGTAEVTLWIISFTVEFGERSAPAPAKLKWPEFQKAFLPSSGAKAEQVVLGTLRITEGLVREVKLKIDNDKETVYRVVNPHELMIETDSAVPCSEVSAGKSIHSAKTPIGIRPMGAKQLTSSHSVTIERVKAPGSSVPAQAFDFDKTFRVVQVSRKSYPEALWSASEQSDKPGRGMITDVPAGVALRVQPTVPQHRVGPFPIQQFAYEPIPDKKIHWAMAQQIPAALNERFPEGPIVAPALLGKIRDCLTKEVDRKSQAGAPVWNDVAMTKTFGDPRNHLQAPPKCAAIGEQI